MAGIFNIVKDRIEKLKINNAMIINEDYEVALNSLDHYLSGEKLACTLSMVPMITGAS